MNLILSFYIFVLFVLFSPNIFLKFNIKNRLLLTFVHGLIFVCILYFTYSLFEYKENLVIGSYSDGDTEFPLTIPIDESTLQNIINEIQESPSPSCFIHNKMIDFSNK